MVRVGTWRRPSRRRSTEARHDRRRTASPGGPPRRSRSTATDDPRGCPRSLKRPPPCCGTPRVPRDSTPAQAEDVVQNTCLSLVQRPGDHRPGRRPQVAAHHDPREAWAAARRSRREDVREDRREDGAAPSVVPPCRTSPPSAVVRSQEQGMLWRTSSTSRSAAKSCSGSSPSPSDPTTPRSRRRWACRRQHRPHPWTLPGQARTRPRRRPRLVGGVVNTAPEPDSRPRRARRLITRQPGPARPRTAPATILQASDPGPADLAERAKFAMSVAALEAEIAEITTITARGRRGAGDRLRPGGHDHLLQRTAAGR